MAFYGGSVGEGFTRGMNEFADSDLRRQQAALEIAALTDAAAGRKRTLDAQPIIGRALKGIYGPGTPPAGIPPFMPMPAAEEAIAPPPARQQKGLPTQADANAIASDAGTKMPQVEVTADPIAQPRQLPRLDLSTIIGALQQQGVSDELIPVVLEGMKGHMQLENKIEMDQLRVMNAQQRAFDAQAHREERLLWDKEKQGQEMDFKKLRQSENAALRRQGLQQKAAAQERELNYKLGREKRLQSKDARIAMTSDPEMKAITLKVQTLRQQIAAGLNFLVNSMDDAQTAAMQTRVADQQAELDTLIDALDDRTDALLAAGTDSGALPQTGKPGAPKAADAKPRPPMPTDPGFDYRFDEARGVWQRKPKGK